MKPLILLMLSVLTAFPQAPSGPAADPVVVTINGKEYTKSQIEGLVRSIGGTVPAQFASDRRGFVETLGLTMRLEEEARKMGIDKQDPYAAQLAYNTMIFLAQSALNEKNKQLRIMPDQQKAHYEKNQKNYASAKVRVLYLAFATSAMPAAGALRSEAEAQALAANIHAELKNGADFVAMVRKYSDDLDSKAKDGEFAPIKPGDTSLPGEIRDMIFSLKPGQTTEPVRQANGYYLFRLESLDVAPYEEVRDQIYMELQKEALDRWMETVRKSVSIDYKDETFFPAPGKR